MPGAAGAGAASSLHPRNRFRDGYDFRRLITAQPALAAFTRTTPRGDTSINFADPAAVMALNQALLRDAYGIDWSVPPGALCPPIPGRLDYVHALADLIGRKKDVIVLDIGCGANAIYPILGAAEYGWRVVGTEIDQGAQRWARQIIRINRGIATLIEIRHQPDRSRIFAGVVHAGDRFTASMCNPPFHRSAEEAADGTLRKQRNLGIARRDRTLNFGGQAGELWCDGGEVGFIGRMIAESAARPDVCGWFTTLVAKSDHLPRLRAALKSVRAADVQVIEMAQGAKKSRLLAWRFTSRP